MILLESDLIIGDRENKEIYLPTKEGITLYLPPPFSGKAFSIFFIVNVGITIKTNDPKFFFWTAGQPTTLQVLSHQNLIGSTIKLNSIAGQWRIFSYSPAENSNFIFKD